MSTVVRGAQLPASPYRDANTDYVMDRGVAALEALGVDAAVVKTAKRGDELLDRAGSIPNLPPRVDGVLTVSELDRLAKPENFGAMFPDEQAALPQVHRLFEVPAEVHIQLPRLPNLSYRLDRALAEAAVTSVPIANLPHELQESARRVQLVRNGDGDADSIQREDIQWAKDAQNQGRFTARTHADLNRIMERFHDDIFTEKVIGTLPPPLQKQTLIQDGAVKVSVATRLELPIASVDGRNPPYYLTPRISARHLIVEAPAGHRVFLKSTTQVANRVSFFERVVQGNGQEQAIADVPNLGTPDHHLWIQILDDRGQMVKNARINVPITELEAFAAAPGLSRKVVTEWRDLQGQVIDHRRAGISGYNAYPHVFKNNQVVAAP